MKFKSNSCIAIHLPDLKAAETFYGKVLGFRLKEKSADMLMFDTGHFKLYINKDRKKQPPIPSFSVNSISQAKKKLLKNKCKIIAELGNAFYFKDPFGLVYDVIED